MTMSLQESQFSNYLASLPLAPVFFEPLEGNNGDELIQMGMKELFLKHQINPKTEPDDVDIIIINGGGAMNDEWPTGAAQVLERYLEKYPKKRFIVGPSSYYFKHLDFAAIVNKTETPITLFCREEISYQALLAMPLGTHVKVRLSQDLAFELKGSDFIAEQRTLLNEKVILCAMRKDREGNSGILSKTSAPWLPSILRKPLSKLRDRLVARKSSDTLTPILASVSSSAETVPVFYRDISVSVPFEEFCEHIRGAKVIITNRLHIAIFGSLLGKKVHLLPGSYHKIAGVYEYSLKANPSVQFHQLTA